MRNEWTDYVQRIVDFAHAFLRFSVIDPKTLQWIPGVLPAFFRVLKGLAGTPTVLLTIRLSRVGPELLKTAAVPSLSLDAGCKTAAVDLHIEAQYTALKLWQVSFLAGHSTCGCCFRQQSWKHGRGLFKTCWGAEVPRWSGCHRVGCPGNYLIAATLENSALWKDFEKS